MTKAFKKKLTLPLVCIIVLIVLIIVSFFLFNTFSSNAIRVTDVKVDTKAAMKLDALKQISKKNGIKEWELIASSATLLKDEDKAVLIDVSIFFFTKENKKVHLVSEKGTLNTKTHDMVFSDNVKVAYETSVLTTDKLHYNKKKHIIYSKSHVRLEKQDSVINADSMILFLNENRTVLEGNVKGKFSEKFVIQ